MAKVIVKNNTGHTRRFTLADSSVLELKAKGCSKPMDINLLTPSLDNAKKLGEIEVTDYIVKKVVEAPTKAVEAPTEVKEPNVKVATKKAKTTTITEKEGEK